MYTSSSLRYKETPLRRTSLVRTDKAVHVVFNLTGLYTL